ncbi:MAG TPA: IS110 family transposase [Actinomycetota bacterium]
MLFVGLDWAEEHHDVVVMDELGGVAAKRRVAEGLAGLAVLHELLAAQVDDPAEVVIGTETDRGLFVGALVAAGYRVYAVNPLAASRYRDRHAVSGAKSDPGDAKVLADLVRTDRHNHRPVAGDSDLAEAVKVLARTHQGLVWARQRQVNRLRSLLREFYPGALAAFGGDLGGRDALAVLAVAPTPTLGRRLPRATLSAVLRRAGRQRGAATRAAALQAALRAPQLQAPEVVAEASGAAVKALVGVIAALDAQLEELTGRLEDRFGQHPDAEFVRSLPGLGLVLGARVVAEFGDDPTRYADPKARKSYAGTAPVTRASGKRRVVLARLARNRRLADACYQWAFSALTASPGARRYYDRCRAAGKTHQQALRALANRLVGILHGCLRHRTRYDELRAWPGTAQDAA